MPNQGLVRDEDRDCVRLSTAIFKTKNQRLSVVIEDTLREEGREPIDALANYSDDFLLAITADIVLKQENSVERTPIDEEPAHADIVGKVTQGKANELCREATWIKAPEDLCPEEPGKPSS
jgi:hypothetical protein